MLSLLDSCRICISIPVWYDWKENANKKELTFDEFQFLYGTIGSRRNRRQKKSYFKALQIYNLHF